MRENYFPRAIRGLSDWDGTRSVKLSYDLRGNVALTVTLDSLYTGSEEQVTTGMEFGFGSNVANHCSTLAIARR